MKLTIVCILALATYTVSRSSLLELVESGDISHTGDSMQHVTSSALTLQVTLHIHASVMWAIIIMDTLFHASVIRTFQLSKHPLVPTCWDK